ncbi:hypothetical protein H2198_004257 [Neophaeococcomyces mojaviensis]|uniref:Uncharacterized protein n=1 Tax=Neophaeococcomyces mojaviensis TaxID=3383035 RepID=A0ACC3A9F4_9EURO|nr:hypothetical protein H2198_004257 [Knufia sp. JES_112]
MLRLGAITGSNAATYNPDESIPPLNGKTMLVTGGSTGLGKQAIIYLAQHSPSEIWMTAQSIDKAKVACADIRKQIPNANLKILQIDLASLNSIKKAAATFVAEVGRLDLLILNAGVMGTPPGRTEDGYEMQFGINHMGHAFLTKLLLPLLTKTADTGVDVRVIVLTLYSHRNAPVGGILFDTLKTTAEHLPSLKRYAQSKLANILYVRQLAKEYPKITVAAVHPGAANTDLSVAATDVGFIDRVMGRFVYRLFIFQSVEVAAKHQVWAATTTNLKSGEYYEPLGVAGEGRPEGRDDDLAKELWDWTEEELKKHVA